MAAARGSHLACPSAPLVAKLGVDDLTTVLAPLGGRDRGALLAAAGVRHRPGAALVGDARLLAARVGRLRPEAAHDLAVLLTGELNRRASFLVTRGGHGDDARFAEGLIEALPALVGEWSPDLVRLQLALLAETGVLDGDEPARLAVALAATTGTAPEPAGPEPEDVHAGEPDGAPRDAPTAKRAPASPLDAVLAVAVADAAGARSGAPALAEVAAAVGELLALEPARLGSWRLQGAIDAHVGTAAGPVALPPTRDAREARLAGRLSALCRAGDQRALAEAAGDDPGALGRLLGNGYLDDAVAVAVLTAAVAALPGGAPAVLDGAAPVTGWPAVIGAVRDRADALLGSGDAGGAERLLRAAEEMLDRWARGEQRPDVTLGGATPERVSAELALARAACRRHRRDFTGAGRLLASLPLDPMPAADRARVATELVLAHAGVAGAGDLRVPATAGERAAFAARVGALEAELDAALELDPGSLLPRWLSGVLAVCRWEDARAAHDLGRVEARLAEDGDAAGAAAVGFHRAVAQLRLLQPGTDADAWRAIDAALPFVDPVAEDLLAACEALAAHGSTALGPALAEVARRHPRDAAVRDLVARLAREGDDRAVAAAVALGAQVDLPLAERFGLLEAALDGMARGGCGAAEEVVAALEDVLVRAGDAGLDGRWSAVLACNDAVRDLLGPANADAARVDVLRRLGRLDDARVLARALFFRAAAGALPGHQPESVLDLLAELDVPDDELAGLARLVTSPATATASGPAPDPRTLAAGDALRWRVVVVGGDEAQDRHLASVPVAVAARSNGAIEVGWQPTGWGSGWGRHAERVEAALPETDAVVLLTAMRTMLGRRLRRSAGEAGVVWVACTGRGRPALEGAIDRAVALAHAARR